MSQIPPAQPGVTYGQPQPPKKKHTGLIVAIVAVALALVCSGIGLSAYNAMLDGDPTAASSPADTTPADVPSVEATTKAAKPSAAPKPKTLLKVSGSGISKTRQFVTGDEWTVSYSYDCSNFGYQGNFIVTEYTGGVMTDVLVNDLKASGHGSSPVYDSGTHYLEINSECSWSVKVVG